MDKNNLPQTFGNLTIRNELEELKFIHKNYGRSYN